MDERRQIEMKIEKLKEKLAQKLRERGEAYGDDVNAWHDNAAFDLAGEEILVMQAQLRELYKKNGAPFRRLIFR